MKDIYFASIWQALKGTNIVDLKLQTRIKYFELRDNRLYLKEGQRFAIPFNKQIRTQLLKEHHDIEISGHVGIDRTYEHIA